MTDPKTLAPEDLLAGAELGDLIQFSDGTPQPPARFNKKLASWRNRNGIGTLSARSDHPRYPTFTLHLGDYGANGTIVLRTYRSFDANTALTFTLARTAPAGSLICCRKTSAGIEMTDITTDLARARQWLSRNPGGVILRVEPDGSRRAVSDTPLAA